jgi:hypothetical protein
LRYGFPYRRQPHWNLNTLACRIYVYTHSHLCALHISFLLIFHQFFVHFTNTYLKNEFKIFLLHILTACYYNPGGINSIIHFFHFKHLCLTVIVIAEFQRYTHNRNSREFEWSSSVKVKLNFPKVTSKSLTKTRLEFSSPETWVFSSSPSHQTA